jgi:hypothetical protein
MRAYLRDPDRNLAEETSFEKTEDLRICRWCNFRALCRPELPSFAEARAAALAAADAHASTSQPQGAASERP